MDQHRLLEFWSSQISPVSATFLQDIKLIEAGEEKHQLKSTSAKLSLPERENIFGAKKIHPKHFNGDYFTCLSDGQLLNRCCTEVGTFVKRGF